MVHVLCVLGQVNLISNLSSSAEFPVTISASLDEEVEPDSMACRCHDTRAVPPDHAKVDLKGVVCSLSERGLASPCLLFLLEIFPLHQVVPRMDAIHFQLFTTRWLLCFGLVIDRWQLSKKPNFLAIFYALGFAIFNDPYIKGDLTYNPPQTPRCPPQLCGWDYTTCSWPATGLPSLPRTCHLQGCVFHAFPPSNKTKEWRRNLGSAADRKHSQACRCITSNAMARRLLTISPRCKPCVFLH